MPHMPQSSPKGALLDTVLWQAFLSPVHQQDDGNCQALSNVQFLSNACIPQQRQAERDQFYACSLSSTSIAGRDLQKEL